MFFTCSDICSDMVELLAKLTKAEKLLSDCYLLYTELDYGNVEDKVDLDKLTDYLTEGKYDIERALAIVEGTVSWYLGEAHEMLKNERKEWAKAGYKVSFKSSDYYGSQEDDGEEPDKNGGEESANDWDDDDEISTECDDDEDEAPESVSKDDDETDSESKIEDVPYPERSPWDDTVSNESERTHKDTVEKFKRQLGLAGDTDIQTLRKDYDPKELLYDGEWDVSKGMRLTVTRKKDDSVHVAVPCKLEKNAQLHHFKNVDGINMSAIYTEDEDGEFWVEEASCMLADEGKMITWWNELHGKK